MSKSLFHPTSATASVSWAKSATAMKATMTGSHTFAFARLKANSSRFGKMIHSLAAVGFIYIVDGHLERDFSLSVAGKAATNTIALTTTADLVFMPEEEGFACVCVPHVIFIAP